MYICVNMGYAKERGKLEKLAKKTNDLTNYDEKSLTVITDLYEQYSHSVRILKNKNPEAFTSLYQNDLEQVKAAKKALKLSEEADRQDDFMKYKEVLLASLNSAIKATEEAA